MSGLLIKNMRCGWKNHRAAFTILVISILAMFMVFPSLALSQMSSLQILEPRTENLHVENSQELVEWPQTISSEQGKYRLTLFPTPGRVPMRRLHAWRLHIEDALGIPVSGAHVRIDGGMPAHGHGLPSAPRVKVLPGKGDYMIEGLKFTMGGEWQLRLAIAHQQTDRVNIVFTLSP